MFRCRRIPGPKSPLATRVTRSLPAIRSASSPLSPVTVARRDDGLDAEKALHEVFQQGRLVDRDRQDLVADLTNFRTTCYASKHGNYPSTTANGRRKRPPPVCVAPDSGDQFERGRSTSALIIPRPVPSHDQHLLARTESVVGLEAVRVFPEYFAHFSHTTPGLSVLTGTPQARGLIYYIHCSLFLNRYLWTSATPEAGQAPGFDAFKTLVTQAIATLRSNNHEPLPVLYRGRGMTPQELEGYEVGKTVFEKGFVSTTSDAKYAQTYFSEKYDGKPEPGHTATIFRISGSGAAEICGPTHEFLFPPGRFTVTDRTTDPKTGILTIGLKEARAQSPGLSENH